MDEIQSVLDFLKAGVSPWHAAAESCRRLGEAGYERLSETEPWTLCPGGKYYTTRNGSAVLAFRIPEEPAAALRIALSHSDVPTWRVKNAGIEKAGCVKLQTEGYGGMIMSSWLDRPLTVAGRIVVKNGDRMETRLVYADQDLLVIPSVAIHFDRGVNDGRKWDPQIDLQPVYGPAGCRPFADLLASEAGGIAPEDILTWDLCLAPRQKPVRIGPAGEFFMSPRIDDLECAGTTLLAFLESAGEGGALPVWGMLDNEEVGSSSRQGAQGTFLADTLARVFEALGMTTSERLRVEAASLVLSADNGHAVHPNHPEKSDPENGPLLNGGVVIKHNANQKYTTDALTCAVFEAICRRAGVPVQHFANRADMPGGSTLGNLQGHSLSAPMLDIGLPQLAMHSAVETAGVEDAVYMIRAVRSFYQTRFVLDGEGGCRFLNA